MVFQGRQNEGNKQTAKNGDGSPPSKKRKIGDDKMEILSGVAAGLATLDSVVTENGGVKRTAADTGGADKANTGNKRVKTAGSKHGDGERPSGKTNNKEEAGSKHGDGDSPPGKTGLQTNGTKDFEDDTNPFNNLASEGGNFTVGHGTSTDQAGVTSIAALHVVMASVQQFIGLVRLCMCVAVSRCVCVAVCVRRGV